VKVTIIIIILMNNDLSQTTENSLQQACRAGACINDITMHSRWPQLLVHWVGFRYCNFLIDFAFSEGHIPLTW